MHRSYSNGHVTKNHGVWRATISYQEGNKRHRLTKSTGIKCYPGKDNRNRVKAEQFLREWREQLVAEDRAMHPEGGDVTFYDYCEHFLSTHHVKAVTMSNYRTHMKKILNTDLGNKRISDVTGSDVNAWLQSWREDGLGDASIAHIRAFVAMVLKHAFAEGRIMRNPMLTVKPTKMTRKPVNSLTPQQRTIVLEKMDKLDNQELALAVRLALLTGMRRGEICALRWADVDLDERVIHVNHALTKAQRYVLDSPKDPAGGNTLRDIPIGNVLVCHLRDQQARQREQLHELGGVWSDMVYVLGNPLDRTFLSPDVLSRQWSMLVQAEGWKGTQGEKVRFHDLRHTFATLAMRFKVLDVMALAKIMGHRDASITLNVYSDALEDAKRQGMDALDATLGREEPQAKPRARHMRIA